MNMSQQGAMITCPNCRQQFSARLPQIIDVNKNPQLKVALLSGQLNAVQCPNCSFVIQVSTPIAYHDATKELLLVHVPMELNLPNDEQERIVGQFTRTITESLPMEQRKGYLFNPRRAFTLQGLLDTVLEADGITKEMLNARKQKVDLMYQMASAAPEDQARLAQENDAMVDEEFMQMVAMSVEALAMRGEEEEAQRIQALQAVLLENTAYGQEVLATMQKQEEAIQAVAQDLQRLGQLGSREQLLDLAVSYAEEEQKLQVLVGLTRQAMDPQFFDLLNTRIEGSNNKQKRQVLRDLREKIQEFTEKVDKQRRAQIQQAGAILQEILNHPNLEEAVEAYLPAISDLVIAVLEANIHGAEDRGDTQTAQQLQTLYEIIRQKIQQSAPPEIQFINELLSIENQTEQRLMLLENAPQFGESLLQYMDALIEDLSSRGAGELVDSLLALRSEAERAINQ